MFGVTPLHILGHIGPRTAPEAGQVTGRLDRPPRRAGQFEQERRSPDHGVLVKPEQSLHAHLDTGGVIAGVIHPMFCTRGRDEMGWRGAVKTLARLPIQSAKRSVSKARRRQVEIAPLIARTRS